MAEWPAPGEEWDVPVARWYRAQQSSGQADFMEQSDVETLWLLADMLNQKRQSGDVPASFLSAWTSACRDLLVTEASRRRARVELEHDTGAAEDEAGPAVTSLHSRLKSS